MTPTEEGAQSSLQPGSESHAGRRQTLSEAAHSAATSLSHAAREAAVAPEPRWPAALALLAVGGLYTAVPRSLGIGFGPRWLLLAVVLLLLVPTMITFRMARHQLNHLFGFVTLAVVTLAEVTSLGFLVWSLPRHLESPGNLLRSAVALWVTNVLVFALWYWRLDAGGPHERDLVPGHTDGAFLFPQMAMDEETRVATGNRYWSPTFVDYLFLSFNHSTALSPTDVAVLSRWAKMLTMVQATVSLTTIALLAARAVNIL